MSESEKKADALIEQRGHTLILTLNRPEARNALSTEMLSIMVEAWDRVDTDPDIRCCILTGAGGYFCAGMDLKAATARPPGDSFKDGSYDPSRIDALLKGRRLTKPLIAAVEGPAIAGGTEILQGTDIRIAGQSAKFGISEAKWSLYPMGGSAVRLVRQIPYTVAADLLLTGRHITAAEAKEIGLIGYVVPDGEALTKALEIAERDQQQRAAGRAGNPALDPGNRGPAGKRRVQDRHPAGHQCVLVRGREGRPEGVRREAHSAVPEQVTPFAEREPVAEFWPDFSQSLHARRGCRPLRRHCLRVRTVYR